ncbi:MULTISPECIES: amino acid ABC transporter permease [Brucella]|uniref:Amino acid ABC transporter permease n=1 Tax=Brucella inopinata TaxID=1218315 RepID=A0AAW7B8U5_9HYPH|nr:MULTISPECIES: amino acid ABC transporter permease [Brucella]KEY04986.1 amino acid ABC transporter [Brucella suis bv. 4 str. 40]EFM56057.1 amino acid ABC transporter, permease protein, 3-TM region, His/Glu/Gln/Arg/opine family [Brucella inopinata BO1]EFM60115.1 amino acid ABC transporter, permease protein, 3-TM region, His/Glu/Gln/Arg/opine family [Brucella sp. BO2]MDL2333433.1 amino acid ABC transporter permease [Brucella inopinata]QGA58786.1 ABC transporter permease subunit [Brucella sp. 2
MDLSILLQYWPILLRGFGLTILCWVLGTIFGMVLGLIIVLAQRYGPRPLGWLIQAYIEIIRGTPFLVQLFVLYYGGPLVGLRLDALPAGLLGLTIYGSPYFAEIFRSGFLAVPRGQLEAARAIGMSEPTIVWRILLPLSLVSALPALVNFSIILTKETVILSIITVPELMYQVQRMSTETFRYLEANLVLALFFWGLVETISRFGRRLETRITKHLVERT